MADEYLKGIADHKTPAWVDKQYPVYFNEEQIDAGAKALREHDMKGRITRPWDQVPKSDKKKWREKASVVLWAVRVPKQITDFLDRIESK